MSGNAYLRKIASVAGGKDPRHAVEAFVRLHRRPTEALDDLAHRLGVSRIVERSLPFEGGLVRLPDGELIIELNSNSPYVRKRFTLAHELGHLLLSTIPAFRGTDCADPPLERTCDLIASELLMPSSNAIDFVANLGKPSPSKLQAIASKFTVSLHTAAIRVHSDFRLWKCAIGCWEAGKEVRTMWFVGPRRWDRTEPDTCSLGSALSSDSSVRCREIWQRGPNSEPIWLNLLRLGDSDRVLGLVGFVN